MICDLMETYHIINYKDIQPDVLGVLVFGLRDNSRVKMKLTDSKLTIEQNFQAMMVDALNFIVWSKTDDARRNRNRPQSILEKIRNKDNISNKECKSFSSKEEFDEALARIRG